MGQWLRNIDVGFGDAVTPRADIVHVPPALATLPAAHVLAYPTDTIVAESLEFDASTIEVATIRDGGRYGGLRVTLVAKLAGATVLAQVRDLLGHASITTTERYDNQTMANLQIAAAKLERGAGVRVAGTANLARRGAISRGDH